MQSTPDLKQADPTPDQKQADPAPDHKQADPVAANPALSAQELDLVARADERLKHAYEQIAHADEQIARFNEQISRLDHDVPRDRSPRLARGSPAGWPALRGLIGLLLAACIFGAAYASQFYGEAAKQMISRWAPQAVAASSLPTEKPQLATQPAVQMAAADATLPQAVPATRTTTQEVAPTAAPMPPELTQLLETISHDLANVLQKTEELKTSQDQLAREQATTNEQVKASQEQLARLVATVSEQEQRAKAATPLPRPVAAPARKPAPPPSTQARAQRQPPMQLQPEPR